MKAIRNENGTTIGHKCDCGKEHKWPGYVFAHYNAELKFTCPYCQEQVIIFECEIQEFREFQ